MCSKELFTTLKNAKPLIDLGTDCVYMNSSCHLSVNSQTKIFK